MKLYKQVHGVTVDLPHKQNKLEKYKWECTTCLGMEKTRSKLLM